MKKGTYTPSCQMLNQINITHEFLEKYYVIGEHLQFCRTYCCQKLSYTKYYTSDFPSKVLYYIFPLQHKWLLLKHSQILKCTRLSALPQFDFRGIHIISDEIIPVSEMDNMEEISLVATLICKFKSPFGLSLTRAATILFAESWGKHPTLCYELCTHNLL